MGTTTSALPKTPAEIRALIRSGEWGGVTGGLAPGHVQANLVILPMELAFDFLLFCQRNPRPCPLLEVLEPGIFEPKCSAPESGPCALTYPGTAFTRAGTWWAKRKTSVPCGAMTLCRSSWAAVFPSSERCSRQGFPCATRSRVPTSPCTPRTFNRPRPGSFSGPMVVSMRPVPQSRVVRAAQVTSRFPAVHGAPVHIGDPAAIGLADIGRPDFGDPTEMREGEVPVFWACGVTPQAVAMECKPPLMITHSPRSDVHHRLAPMRTWPFCNRCPRNVPARRENELWESAPGTASANPPPGRVSVSDSA